MIKASGFADILDDGKSIDPRLGLPFEIWDHIFSYLPWKDRPCFAATCRAWHNIALGPEKKRIIKLIEECTKVLFAFSDAFELPARAHYLPPFQYGEERVSEKLKQIQPHPLSKLPLYLKGCQDNDLQALLDLSSEVLAAKKLSFIYRQDKSLLYIFSKILLQTRTYKKKHLGVLDGSEPLMRYLNHHFSPFSQVKAIVQRVPCECAKMPGQEACALNIDAYVKTGDFAPLLTYLLGDGLASDKPIYAKRRTRLAGLLMLEVKTLSENPLLPVRAKELLAWRSFLHHLLQRVLPDKALKQATKRLEKAMLECCTNLYSSWSFPCKEIPQEFALAYSLLQALETYPDVKPLYLLRLWIFQITSGHLAEFYYYFQKELESLAFDAREDFICLTVAALKVLQKKFFQDDVSFLLFLTQQVHTPALQNSLRDFVEEKAPPVLIPSPHLPTLEDLRPSSFDFHRVMLEDLPALKNSFQQALRICSLLDKRPSLKYFLSKHAAPPADDASMHQADVLETFFYDLNTCSEAVLACGLTTLFADTELALAFLHHFIPTPHQVFSSLSLLDDALVQLLKADRLHIPHDAWSALAYKFASVRGKAQTAYFATALWLMHEHLMRSLDEDPDYNAIADLFTRMEDCPDLWPLGALWLPKLLDATCGDDVGLNMNIVLKNLPKKMQLPLFKEFMTHIENCPRLSYWKVWLEVANEFPWGSLHGVQEAQRAVSERLISFHPDLFYLPENCYPLLYDTDFFYKIHTS